MIWWLLLVLITALVALAVGLVLGFRLAERRTERLAYAEEEFARDVEGRLVGEDANHYKSTAPRAVIHTPRFARSHMWNRDNNENS